MTLRVRFAETDQMGIAHHSSYVIWMEAARVEWLRERGLSYKALEESGVSLAVSSLRVDYRKSASFDDELELSVTLTALRSRHLTLTYEVKRSADGALVALGETDHIATDRSGKAVRIPSEWVTPLKAHVADPSTT